VDGIALIHVPRAPRGNRMVIEWRRAPRRKAGNSLRLRTGHSGVWYCSGQQVSYAAAAPVVGWRGGGLDVSAEQSGLGFRI
jgi:hypothetical protein